MRQDEEFRRSSPDEDCRIADESILADHFEESGQALASGKAYADKDARRRVEEAFSAVGIEIPPADGEEVASKASEGYNLALQAIRSRIGGEYLPTVDCA